VARVLIVGCGCRGRELVGALAADGHVARGTTRSEAGLAAIEAVGAHGVVADPDRLATLMPHLFGVSVLCWLMGSAAGDPETVEALHGPRLESLVWKLVDTHVRGVVYAAAGTVPPELLDRGAGILRRAHDTFNMPVELVAHDPADRAGWLTAMTAAVGSVLSA
jgi:hypothetical protein